jgi:lipopolysaccharide export system protein LptA
MYRTVRLLGFSACMLVLALGSASAQKAQKADQKTDEGSGMPNALQGFSRNKNEPVKIESNKLEVRDKEKLAIFTGNVFVQQGDTTMRSPELRVFYEADENSKKGAKKNAGVPAAAPGTTPVAATKTPSGNVTTTESNASQKIKKIEALGGVIVNSKDQKATGTRADFMMRENIVILTGDVVVSQGQNVMRGDKLIVELNTNKAHMEAGTKDKPGRVQGLFLPSDKDEKKKDGDKDKTSESGKKKNKTKAQSDTTSPIH